jgi:hypothetical protein
MKNPYLNAVAAAVYIGLVGTFMNFVERSGTQPDSKWLGGIAFISLVTLSVATMGYFFAFKPLQMYLDGQKQEAVSFFLKTVGTFAVITVVLLLIAFAI